MKIVNNYTDKVSDLITGNQTYNLEPNLITELTSEARISPAIFDRPEIVLNILSTGGTFQSSFTLENNTDFYIKNGQIYLKPNEVLDREGFFAGNYNLRFDFVHPIAKTIQSELYLDEVSPSRKEIRLSTPPEFTTNADGSRTKVEFFNQDKRTKTDTFFGINDPTVDRYNFDCHIELSGGRTIPINSYAFDLVTGNKTSLILKLNQEFPTDIAILDRDFRLVKKWFASQEQSITFIDEEGLATGGGRSLDVDTSYLTENSNIEDDITTYSDIITGSEDVVSSFTQRKKDVNLNIDFSEFSNHVFFGSAVSKLENFKDKVVKLEGLYSQLLST